MKIDVKVGVEMPDKMKDEYRQPTLCEKCRDYMVECEGDADSSYHWDYIKAIYKKLTELKNKPPHLKELTLEIEDFLLKHTNSNYQENDGKPFLDHENLERLK